MGVNISRDLGNTPRPESTSCVNNIPHRKSANRTDFQSDVQIGLYWRFLHYRKAVRDHYSALTFYPRDAMLARVIAIATCLSVCLSVTRRYCVKTKKASGMISAPTGSPKTVVFWRKISSPNSKGSPRTGASNKGRSEKFSDFLALSVYISKTVADTAKVTISD